MLLLSVWLQTFSCPPTIEHEPRKNQSTQHPLLHTHKCATQPSPPLRSIDWRPFWPISCGMNQMGLLPSRYWCYRGHQRVPQRQEKLVQNGGGNSTISNIPSLLKTMTTTKAAFVCSRGHLDDDIYFCHNALLSHVTSAFSLCIRKTHDVRMQQHLCDCMNKITGPHLVRVASIFLLHF